MNPKNSLTRKEKIDLINLFIEDKKGRDDLYDNLKLSFGDCIESPLFAQLFATEDLALTYLKKLIGDEYDWLDWFIYENDCGKKGYEAGEKGNLKPVKTIEDILEIIESSTTLS